MCLFVGVVAKVQVPRWVACQCLLLDFSFCSSGSSNLEPPTMGIAVALSSIAVTIPLRWWQMMAHSKAHNPIRRFRWLTADWAANNLVKMMALVGAIESASRFNSANES